jgi:hypothetical protein
MNHKYESRVTVDESQKIHTRLLGINQQMRDKINMQNKPNYNTGKNLSRLRRGLFSFA